MTQEELVSAGLGKKDIQIICGGQIYTLLKDYQNSFSSGYLTYGWNNYELKQISEVFQVGETTTISPPTITFGSDPELFVVAKDKSVVPSPAVVTASSIVKPDGFQIELNPVAHTCRQSASGYITEALCQARAMAQSKGYDLSFSVGHTITDSVWSAVGIALKRFGCNPTVNAHEKSFKRVTGLREKFRAGGGHIHLGMPTSIKLDTEKANRMVMLMDIIAGNSCVLLDRDPDNARRRKNYGRAGEYRLKSYGLEYRVLSNFWLKKYVLWSTASGLLRQAVAFYQQPKLADELMSRFNMKDIRDAINNNDKELAMKNFMILHDFFIEKKIVSSSGFSFINIKKFLIWASEEDPIKRLNVDTTDKIMASWINRNGENFHGLEQFLYSL